MTYHQLKKSEKIQSIISRFKIYTFSQENFAEYEQRTDDYNVINILFGLSFFKNIKCTLAANNIMNIEYSPHTSRIRGVAGGVPNPGRSLDINLHYEF